jgi:anthranilate synthase component 2
VIKETLGKIPILGICLGHQCLAHYFGAEVTFAKKPMHGKPSRITHDRLGLFSNIPSPHTVIRYHSLSVNPATIPPILKITATTDCGEIMGLRHQEGLFESVQYHPDSVMTEFNETFFSNFITRGFS